MDWSELVPDLVKLPLKVYKNRKFIQHWWIKILAIANIGGTDIAILGSASVGKTLLSKSLQGQSGNFKFKVPGQSPDVETDAIIFGEWTRLVRVIPGQTGRERANGLEELFHESESLDGIIYVVDWGFSSSREIDSQNSLIEKGFDTVEKLRTYNLTNELDDLKLVMDKIKDSHLRCASPKWLLIAVNKVDLFYSNINDAQKYYCMEFESAFTKIIKDAQNQIGNLNLKVATLPMSSWQEEFLWNNEKISTNLGGKPIEFRLALNFISKIAELSKTNK